MITPWVNHIFLVPIIVIAICLAGLLLNRLGRDDKVIKGLLILGLHTLIVAFRSKDIFSFINSLFPINHVGWLILILIVFIAFFLTLRLMQGAGAKFPYKYVEQINVIYLILLTTIFIFVCQTPANINGRLVYTVSQGLFMTLYYVYAVYLSVGLFRMAIDLRKNESVNYKKHRWTAIGIIFILYATYNFLALLNIAFVYSVGEKLRIITITNSIVLLITTFAVIPIFGPGWIYKQLDRAIDFYQRAIALYKLLKVKAALKKERFCGFEIIEPDKSIVELLNINFHLHKCLMFIQDYKYHAMHSSQTQNSKETLKEFPVTFAIIQADDKKNGLDLIKAYNNCLGLNHSS